MSMQNEEQVLQGVSISEGVAIGFPFILAKKKHVVHEISLESKDLEGEIERYRHALKQSRQDVQCLQNSFRQDGYSTILDIFETHLEILRDPVLTVMMEEKIREMKKNSEAVFSLTIEEYVNRFKKISDPFFRERLKDVTDVSSRVLKHLLHSHKLETLQIPEQSIVFAKEIIPSDIAEVKTSFVEAFVTEQGGYASHAAIIARARGLPYVTHIPMQSFAGASRDSVIIVDGTKGQVILYPSQKTLE
ncbi:MAG: phosphoenolpyruvate-utilizing N-terminal domain-containing protein, partial [Chlamydiota bacterium]